MTSTQEAWSLLNLAHETLQAAEENRRIGIYRVAVSVAYYAVFYAARAVIAYHRKEAKSHKGTIARFYTLAVHGSDFPSETASLLGQLKKVRAQADYDQAAMDWRDADASDAIARARTFVNEATAWFDRHVPSIDRVDRG